MNQVANDEQKLMVVPADTISISRFTMADIQSYGAWLLDRLKDRWQINERNIYGFLRGCTEDRESIFVKSTNAVGLAQIVHKRMVANPDVEEVFVKVFNPKLESHLLEGAALYREFHRWGRSLNPIAQELIVDRFTDVPRIMINEQIGLLLKRQSSYVRLGG